MLFLRVRLIITITITIIIVIILDFFYLSTSNKRNEQKCITSILDMD